MCVRRSQVATPGCGHRSGQSRTKRSSQQHQQELSTDEESGPKAGKKSIASHLQARTRTGRGPGQGPGQGPRPGRSRVRGERRYGRHELCGQHRRQELSQHDSEGHRRLVEQITVTGFDVMCMCIAKKGNPVFRKKVMSVVVICQRKFRHWKKSTFICFKDNTGVIVNVTGEMKDSAITRQVSQRAFRRSQQSGEHDRDE